MGEVRLTATEQTRIAKADQSGFVALLHAIEDIVTERMGGIPRIPTPPTATPDQAGTSAEEGRQWPGVPTAPPQAAQGDVSASEGPSRANDTGAIREGSA